VNKNASEVFCDCHALVKMTVGGWMRIPDIRILGSGRWDRWNQNADSRVANFSTYTEVYRNRFPHRTQAKQSESPYPGSNSSQTSYSTLRLTKPTQNTRKKNRMRYHDQQNVISLARKKYGHYAHLSKPNSNQVQQ
jgi:hypothetical protein